MDAYNQCKWNKYARYYFQCFINRKDFLMEKAWFYQPHIRYSEKPVTWFFSFLLTICFFLPLILGCYSPFWSCPSVRLSVFLAGTILCFMYLARLTCRYFINAPIVITDEKLVHYGFWYGKQISFGDVISVKHFNFMYWFGFIAVTGSRSTIFIPFVIDDSFGLIKNLCERLDAFGKSHLCNTSGFSRFSHAARINDIVNRKIYGDLKKLSAWTLSSTFFSLIISFWIWEESIMSALRWGYVGLIVPLIAYLCGNMVIAHKVSKSQDNGNNASDYCNTALVYTVCGYVSGIVYILAGILFKSVAQ